ncbi:TPA_exp: Uncharacterized protein A8136_5537 [Trichophyton benhamiae CBS 112371]|uniref:Integral membrane protein n=1 Tax=Arthroderma benhamiae (strain ATCC MYA-4681 / CBS 112371) TaxID=663331 RepID=D4ANS1_ARTBC|nr:uncharacterized protein ARB_05888 [Trichophyton benhamiae CBS 112371]EFE34932.1 hypothetical protein ARB_05888 [Trichophyton benhamiae CBS 112371]DAA77834.1 TPA_exp: Uncharacterized protein A8136_5537 [Trichophyton benhamiae CBS 112371]
MRPLARLLSSCGALISPRWSLRYLLAAFVLCYLLLLQYCRSHSFRDPTSLFFDAGRGYEPRYSRFRAAEAANFVRHIDAVAAARNGSIDGASLPLPGTGPPGLQKTNASLCVGIASIAREGVSYIEATVGALLMDLSPQERQDIYLILFIPHTDPSIHPSYASNWLPALVDRVLYYDVDKETLDHLRKLEQDGGLFREKGLFDYSYLLKACAAVDTPHVLMVEDDVLAMDGWYHRTKQALAAAGRQTRQLGASKYLYLRLFYTQGLLGWNNEEWLAYLAGSMLFIAAFWVILVAIRRCLPHPNHTSHPGHANSLLSNKAILLISLTCGPLFIILFFASGRLTVLPIRPGVHQMPRFGCCTQALAFPHDRVPDVVSWYESKKIGFADSLLEEYANANDEIRWALTPSVFQHVGGRSSKQDGPGSDEVAKVIWNSAFELNDPVALQTEHENAAEHAPF